MWASEVAADDPAALQRRLFDEHRIEVVVSGWEGKNLLRVSIAPYNEAADVERLLEALAESVAPPA
jgi:selenocysteine lyase/cysteine desulfurase